MIRGIYIGRPLVSGGITFTVFVFRAVSTYTTNWLIEIMTNPIVVFVLFLIAGIIITYPFLRGWRALVIGPIMVAMMVFFVYTYYIL